MEKILFYTSYYISCFFEIYVVSKYMKLFLGELRVTINKTFLVYFIRVLVASILYFYFPYVILNIIMSFGTLILITMCYDNKWSNRILSCIYIYMCMFIAEAVFAVIVNVNQFSITGNSYEGNTFTYIGIQIISYVIYQIIRHFKSINTKIELPISFSILTIMLNIICFIFEIIIFQQENIHKSVKLLSVIWLLLIIFIVAYLQDTISQNATLKVQEGLIQSEKKYYCMQADLLRKNTEELRKFKHDINNHLNVLCTMSQTNEVSEYLSNLTKRLQQTSMYSNTGNNAIDGIINYKFTIAEEENIDIKTEISIPNKTLIDNDDMVSIIGNLLDNAIEAQKYVADRKYIVFKLCYKKGAILMYIENSFDGNLKRNNNCFKTRKKDTNIHGIGIKSVKSSVEKYNGQLEIDYEEYVFKVKIILYTP